MEHFFSWLWSSHLICTLTFIVYSCFVFMSHIYALLDWVFWYHVDFLFHEKQFVFIPYLKDFVLVNKFFHLTSSYSSYGRCFQTYKKFSNLFLKTPTVHGRMDGRSCSCMLYNENHFKLEHDWVVVIWCIHLIIIICFNWYHWDSFNWYQFWPFLYTHICLYVCMFFNSNSINFDWY